MKIFRAMAKILLVVSLWGLLTESSIAKPKSVASQYSRDPNSIPVYYSYEVPNNSIVIDGKLDEPCWKKKPQITFRDLTNDSLPLYRGTCTILWDENYLYIGYKLLDQNVFASIMELPNEGPPTSKPGQGWVKEKGNEIKIMAKDPFVKFFLDPDGDGKDYLEFHINAANAVADLNLDKPYSAYSQLASGMHLKEALKHKFQNYAHANWKWFMPNLRTAVKVNGTLNDARDKDHGWSVEMAIPWSELQKHSSSPCPPANVRSWRCHLGQVFYKKRSAKRKYWTWPVFDVFDCHIPAQWGFLNFVSLEKQQNNSGAKSNIWEQNRLIVKANKRLFHRYNITAICSGIKQLTNIPIADYQAAGITKIFFYVKNPVIINSENKPVWKKSATRDKIFNCFKAFAKSGIELVPITGLFYAKHPAKAENMAQTQLLQQSRWSKKKKYRCFSSELDATIKRLNFMVKELAQFSNFKAICLDDEAGAVAGGCTCQRCYQEFSQLTKLKVPTKDDYLQLPTGVVPASNSVIQWDKFQKQELKRFYLKLTVAMQQSHSALDVFTIPAAAYFSGKQLSIKNCQDKTFFKSNRNVTLDPTHIRDYQLYVQFYINRIARTGWQEKYADGLCLFMMAKGLPNFCNIPIYDADKKSKSSLISMAAFKRFILQTFAEGSHGIVYFPFNKLSQEHRQVAAETYSKVIKPLISELGRLRQISPKVGIFYSSTSRALADIWKNNPIERYKQLHECDAVAYYLKKRGIPFKMIVENEISSRKELQELTTVILPDVDYISRQAIDILVAYIRNGGKVILNSKNSVKIPGATEVTFSADKWYESMVNATANRQTMEKQWTVLDKTLAAVLPDSLAICRSSEHELNINYLTDGKNIYLFLVNNRLYKPLKTVINFNRSYDVEDIFNHKNKSQIKELEINIEPAGIKIIKLKH